MAWHCQRQISLAFVVSGLPHLRRGHWAHSIPDDTWGTVVTVHRTLAEKPWWCLETPQSTQSMLVSDRTSSPALKRAHSSPTHIEILTPLGLCRRSCRQPNRAASRFQKVCCGYCSLERYGNIGNCSCLQSWRLFVGPHSHSEIQLQSPFFQGVATCKYSTMGGC